MIGHREGTMRNRPALSVALVVTGGLGATTLIAQTPDPPYLKDFPTPDRVKQVMKVADPKETALRQLGAFYQLQEILKQLSGRREYRGFTPGEGKLIGDYGVAEYYTAQAADSAYQGPYGRLRKLTDSTPFRYARTDPRFGVEGIEVFKLLLNPAIQEQYDQLAGVDRARIVAKAKEDDRDRANGGRVLVGGDKPAASESRRQMRRCVESGRSEGDCLSEGMKGGVRELLGGLPDLFPGKEPGLRLVGTWPGPGKFGLSFAFDQVTLNCGDLVPQIVDYALARSAAGLEVTVSLDQGPMKFTVREASTLVGPAGADIKGQIIVGYQPGVRTYSDGHQEPISRAVYGDATRHCSIGSLTVSSPTTSLAGVGSTNPMLDMLAGGLDRLTQQVPTGLRLTGQYRGDGDLDLNFLPDGAVVTCGDVGVLRPYRIKVEGGQTVVTVNNGGVAFSLTLAPNGTLNGSGTIQVDGRKITGSGPDGKLAYAPKTLSCPVGNLSPIKKS
jgi:hypothetical protein